MTRFLARMIQPNMCLHKIRIIQSYKAPDRMLPDGTIEIGERIEQAQICGRRPGHTGQHGPWGRWYRWRTVLANRIDP